MPPIISTGALLASTGLNALGGLLGSSVSQSYNKENMALQDLYARQLMKYQWDNFSSPAAQIKSLAGQGANPAALLEGGKISGSAPTPTMPSSVPIHVDNLMDISALSQLLTAVGSAKKAGADVKVAEENAKNLAADTALKDFQNELNQMFGKEFKSVELSQAYQNLVLLSDSHDLNEIEKAIGVFKTETEKAVASAKGSEAEIIRQRLENNPTVIALENKLNEAKIKTEESIQANQYASARASNASAEQNEIFNKIYSDARYKHSLITQAVEAGRQAVEQRKLTKSQAEHMNYMVQQAAYSTDMQEFTYWSNQIQGFVHSIGEAASSFYGAGALRELIKVRQAAGKPNFESGKNFYIDENGLLFKRP